MNSKTFNDGYQKNDLPLFQKGAESQDFIPEQHVRKADPATSRMASDQAGGLSHRHCAEIKKTLDGVFPRGLNFEEIANLAGFAQTTQVSRRIGARPGDARQGKGLLYATRGRVYIYLIGARLGPAGRGEASQGKGLLYESARRIIRISTQGFRLTNSDPRVSFSP